MNQLFNAPSFSIEELEARQELSIVAPGDLATEAVKKDGDDRCDGDKEAPIDVTVG
ncbi:MAG: hypothetical protein HUU01_20470 [Saprospiraceae bacterium]|nr:hypothetical protein [Saprospiraceae bacterium]NUO02991.1 hypothetical protein [Saprospiraceae bacterium]